MVTGRTRGRSAGRDRRPPTPSRAERVNRTTAVHPVVRLQSRVGNGAAGSVLRTKLRLGRPDDIHEREVDRVADDVMRMPHSDPGPPVQRLARRSIRRCPECKREDAPRVPQGHVRHLLPASEKAKPARARAGSRENAEPEAPIPKARASDHVRRREHKADEEPHLQQAKAAFTAAPDGPPSVESSIHASRGGGTGMLRESRSFFESRVGSDVSSVRIHADSSAASAARLLRARAFTVGIDEFHGTGEYRPETSGGRRLLARELTHVVPQSRTDRAIAAGRGAPKGGGPGPRVIQKDDDVSGANGTTAGTRREHFYDIRASHERAATSPDIGVLDRAEARRTVLLLDHRESEALSSAEDLEHYLDRVEDIATSEVATAAEVGLRFLWIFPEAFPGLWAGIVESTLDLEWDVAERVRAVTANESTLTSLLGRMPDGLLSYGLPLSRQAVVRQVEFELLHEHTDLDENHDVRTYARALTRHTGLVAARNFCIAWGQAARSAAHDVRDGRTTASPEALDAFSRHRDYLVSLPDEIARSSPGRERFSLFAAFFSRSYHPFEGVAIRAGGEAANAASRTWDEGKKRFAHRLARADAAVRATPYWDRVRKAISWAEHRDYFGGAIGDYWRAIVDNAPKILGTAGVLTGALVAVQFVPVLNVIVDLALLLWGGYEIIKAVMEVKAALDMAGHASSVLGLQRASVRMADIAADKLFAFLEWIGGKGLHQLIRARAESWRRRDARATDKDIADRAAREARDETPGQERPPAAGRRKKRPVLPDSLSGCRLGSIHCPIQFLEGHPTYQAHFSARKTEDFDRFVGDPPEIDLDFGPSVRKLGGVEIKTGNAMYRQFLEEVPPDNWLPGMREKMAEIHLRSAREGVDYRVLPGTDLRWPLDDVGSPWTVHHEPPLNWVQAEGSHLWRPMPYRIHQEAHDWWTGLDRLVRENVPPELRTFLIRGDVQVDIRGH